MIYEPLPEKDLLDMAYEKASSVYRATEQFFRLNHEDKSDDKLMKILSKSCKLDLDGDHSWTWMRS